MKLPTLPPREWRSYFALAFSILGAIALTLFAGWIVWILWLGDWPVTTAPQRIEALGKSLLVLIVTVAVTQFALGFAINRRTIQARAFGAELEASGGEDDPPPVAQVTTTTTVAAPAAPGPQP